jgi:hypothetical protein
MTLRLNGNTSGYTEIDSPAIGNNNLLTLPTTTAGTLIAADSSGVLQMNSGYGSNANAYGCRAWVNFNGTGTVAIRASGNVSSITDNGTADYTVNFTTALVDANYAASLSSGQNSATQYVVTCMMSQTASAMRITNANFGSGFADNANMFVTIFR